MKKNQIRIFTYLPNPRIWKALIAADIQRINIELRSDSPTNLKNWLWDFNARPLSEKVKKSSDNSYIQAQKGFKGNLIKTKKFLKLNPYGTVPVAFNISGSIGVFESNSILRAVARVGKDTNLYGKDEYEASRIDSFLDANLVFARESQVYMLDYENVSKEGYKRMTLAYEFYMSGIESALGLNSYIAGEDLTIADISFVCDFSQFLREGHYEDILKSRGFQLISNNFKDDYPKAFIHLNSLIEREEFSSVLESYLEWYKTKLNI